MQPFPTLQALKYVMKSCIIHSILIPEWYRYRLSLKAEISVRYQRWKHHTGTCSFCVAAPVGPFSRLVVHCVHCVLVVQPPLLLVSPQGFTSAAQWRSRQRPRSRRSCTRWPSASTDARSPRSPAGAATKTFSTAPMWWRSLCTESASPSR